MYCRLSEEDEKNNKKKKVDSGGDWRGGVEQGIRVSIFSFC